jgi:hypothetical protein
MLFVKQVTTKECHELILNVHYARRLPSISYAYGLFEGDELVGCVTYGTPASSTLLRGVCGEEYKGIVKELNRLVLRYNRPNEASTLVSRSFKLLPHPLVIVSYADTSQGHTGTVYQATNFLYTGLSAKFKDPKVRGLEHQHHATYGHGMTNKQLKEKFGGDLYFVERPRKHRYIMFLGSKVEKKHMRRALRYPVLPYPC